MAGPGGPAVGSVVPGGEALWRPNTVTHGSESPSYLLCFPLHMPPKVGAETLSQEPPKLLWREFRKTHLVWESLKMLSRAVDQPEASHAGARTPPARDRVPCTRGLGPIATVLRVPYTAYPAPRISYRARGPWRRAV